MPIPGNNSEGIIITGLDGVEYGQKGRVLVRVETNSDLIGYGTAGGNGTTVRGQLQQMENLLIGEDPLAIEKHYDTMMGQQHSHRAHVPTVSGVDIALWDLAGKMLNRPISELLIGQFRQEVPFYITSKPDDPLDPDSYREWADRIMSGPDRPSAVKVGFDEVLRAESPDTVQYAVRRNRQSLTQIELNAIREAAETVRNVLGQNMDFIAHLHNGLDLASAIGFAEAVAPAQPLWLEDPISVEYSESWKTIRQDAPCRVLTGEKLEGVTEFEPFILNGAVDLIQPDLAFAGGITGTRRIAQLADRYQLPVTAHNTSGLIQNAATVHLAASIRNFWMTETKITYADFIRDMGDVNGLEAQDGKLTVPDGPGLGVTLNDQAIRSYLADGEEYWD